MEKEFIARTNDTTEGVFVTKANAEEFIRTKLYPQYANQVNIIFTDDNNVTVNNSGKLPLDSYYVKENGYWECYNEDVFFDKYEIVC